MPGILNPKRGATVLLYLSLMFCACHQVQEIPFPEDLADYPQPQTFPLEFTDPKPLHWDTIGKGTLKPTAFPLNFQKLRGMPYDSSGFKPLPYPVTTSSFDFSALPSRAFELDRMTAHPLNMTTTVLPPPGSSIRLQKPDRVHEMTADIRVWQQINLLNMNVYGITRDINGLLWFATNNGIYRYDGVLLTNIIPGAFCYSLYFDKTGNLWYLDAIDVNRAAIIKVDFKNKTTGKHFFNFGTNAIIRMATDHEGNIWVSGSDTPPVMISPREMAYYIIDNNAGFKSNRYYFPTVDHEGQTWIGSRNGIEIIDRKANKITHIGKENGLVNDTVTAIITAPDGRVWAAAGSDDVEAIDIRTGKISHYRISNMNGTQRSFCMRLDKAGQLWIGRTDGVYILNFDKPTLRHITNVAGYDFVVDMAASQTGDMIAAGYSSSLNRSIVYTIAQNGKTVYPFRSTPIISSTEDSKGNLWVGTENELFVVDSARSTYWRLDTTDGLANKYIQSVTEQNGKVVITSNGGYNIFAPSKNEWLRVTRKEGLLTDSVYSLLTDHQDNVWVTGTSKGIFKYDRATGYILNLSSQGGLNGNNVVQAAALPGTNNVWMVTVEGGPNIIDPENNSIRFIKNIPGMDTFSYKGITADSHGRTWITGTNGYSLYMIDPADKKVTRFTTKEGLADNSINSLLEYKGRMLVCTNQMVNIITPPELSSRHSWEVNLLRHSEGLKKSTTSFVSDAITKRGDYLWGDAGLGVIYGIAPDTSSGINYLTGIKVMGRNLIFAESDKGRASDTALQKNNTLLSSAGYIEKGNDLKWDSLSGLNNLPVNLSLPHDRNIIQFSFSEVSTGRQDTLEFAYVLEGLDKQWAFTKELQTETYLNLSPGDYIFKVTSRWQNGKWNTPATFSFTIRPPWYSTWWAYLLYLVAAITLLRLYIIFRSRKLVRANKLLEEKVNSRTEELRQSYNNVEKLEEIGKKITSSLSVEKIIGTVYNNVNALMDAKVFGIGIYNEPSGRLEFPSTYENGHILPFYSNALTDKNRLSTICFNEGKEIVMGNVGEEHKDYIQQIPVPVAGDQAVSLIYLPLVAKEKKLGVITVQSFKQDAYSDYHLYMLRNIAIYTAIALENARSYEDLRSAQAQLVQSEKMASLGELTAGIAHEIQNPLNFVNNFSEVNIDLIREMDEEIGKGNYDEVRELAANIRGNEEKIIFHGKRADGIVKSMLQHSRNSSTSKEFTDINSLCDEYLRLAFHGMRAKDKSFNSGMETSFDENAGKINLVPQDIGRVLLNLLTNAFYEVNEKRKKAYPEYRPMVKMKTTRSGGNVEIEVSDNGKGIPEDVKKKIFQPFFTTKPTGKGTGLGLSLSYDIVKAHGGEIKVETKENEGSKFIIQLPIAGS